MGAKRVLAFATHGLFSGKAIENIANSTIDQIIVTNTIPASKAEADLGDRVQRLSVGTSFSSHSPTPR
jgi:ribose-phosphate pyrophosphokinase